LYIRLAQHLANAENFVQVTRVISPSCFENHHNSLTRFNDTHNVMNATVQSQTAFAPLNNVPAQLTAVSFSRERFAQICKYACMLLLASRAYYGESTQ
jgi:hypothetical protein